MSGIITDEMVEKARTAANEVASTERGLEEYCGTEMMRVALTAILPDIVEVCAKKADVNCRNPNLHTCGDEIRSLAPKEASVVPSTTKDTTP